MPLHHPQLLTDDELCAWTRALLERREPESDWLDYKAVLNLPGQRERLELAKDISSFANERGGTLLYGVPEEEAGGVPVPAALHACGFEIPPGLPEGAENIIGDTIDPPLPELFVKPVALPEIAPRRLLLIHHPASWNRPHMVVGYDDGRYYRRANYRVVRMTEREVEAAYAARRAWAEAAREFFATGDFGDPLPEGVFLRVIICPRFSLVRRQLMREREFREWLHENNPEGRRGDWVPSLDGVRFLSYADGALQGRLFEFRLFHSGGVAYTRDMSRLVERPQLNLDQLRQHLDEYPLTFARRALEMLGIDGPIAIQVSLHHVNGLPGFYPSRHPVGDPEMGPVAITRDKLTFTEESSVTELLTRGDAVVSRLVDRVASAFGLWRREQPAGR